LERVNKDISVNVINARESFHKTETVRPDDLDEEDMQERVYDALNDENEES